MGFNFAQFLGGLGAGAQQFAAGEQERRRQEEAAKLSAAQLGLTQLQNQRMFDLQQKQFGLAEDRANREEARLLESQVRDSYQKIQDIIRRDAASEAATLDVLRDPAADDETKSTFIKQRLAEHESNKQELGFYAGLPEMQKRFGDKLPSQLIPTRIREGLKLPPKINMVELNKAIDADRRYIAGLAEKDKPTQILTTRQKYVNLGVPQDRVKSDFPMPDEKIGEVTRKRYRPATPEERRAITPFGSPSLTLPPPGTPPFDLKAWQTGADQAGRGMGAISRAFTPQGTVEITETSPVYGGYPASEMAGIKVQQAQQSLDQLNALFGPKMRQANAAATKAEYDAAIRGIDLKFHGKLLESKIAANFARQARAAANKGSSLADGIKQLAFESLNMYRQAQIAGNQQAMQLNWARLNAGKIAGYERQFADYDRQINDLQVKAGVFATMGQEAARKAAMDGVANLKAKQAELRPILDALKAGDIESANQAAFGATKFKDFMNMSDATVAQMAALGQGRGQQGQGTAPIVIPPAPVSPAPAVTVYNVPPATAVPGATPVTTPGAAPGSMGSFLTGALGLYSPSGGPTPDLDNVNATAKEAAALAEYKKQFPHVPENTIRSVMINGTIAESTLKGLERINSQNKADKEKAQRKTALARTPITIQPTAETLRKRKPGMYYKGTMTEYKGETFQDYPLSRAEYNRRIQNKLPIPEKIERVYYTPQPR